MTLPIRMVFCGWALCWALTASAAQFVVTTKVSAPPRFVVDTIVTPPLPKPREVPTPTTTYEPEPEPEPEPVVEAEPPEPVGVAFAPVVSGPSQMVYHISLYVLSKHAESEKLSKAFACCEHRFVVNTVVDSNPRGLNLSPTAFPFATWHDAAGVLRYSLVDKTPEAIYQRIQNNNPPRQLAKDVAETGTAGTMYAAGTVSSMLDWWDKNVGTATAYAKIDRTGKDKFDLLHRGVQWTPENILGRFGRFRVGIQGKPELILDHLGFAYEVDGKDLTVAPDKMTFKGWGEKLMPQTSEAAVGAQEVGMDPMTIWTIISVVRFIVSACNPSVDLEMGGNIDCEAVMKNKVLTITFTQGPRIRAQFLGEWLLGIKSVQISATNLHVNFLPQPDAWIQIRERDIPIKSFSKAPPPLALAAPISVAVPPPKTAAPVQQLMIGTGYVEAEGMAIEDHLRSHGAPEWEIQACQGNRELLCRLHSKYHGSPTVPAFSPTVPAFPPAAATQAPATLQTQVAAPVSKPATPSLIPSFQSLRPQQQQCTGPNCPGYSRPSKKARRGG